MREMETETQAQRKRGRDRWTALGEKPDVSEEPSKGDTERKTWNSAAPNTSLRPATAE